MSMGKMVNTLSLAGFTAREAHSDGIRGPRSEPRIGPRHRRNQDRGQLPRSHTATPGGGSPQAGRHGTHRVAGPPLPREAARAN